MATAVKLNLEDVLSGASKPATKKKSSVPTVQAGQNTAILVDRIRHLKAEIESAEAMLEVSLTDVLKAVAPLREELCRREYTSSVRLSGATGTVLLSWKDAYSKIALEDEKRLKMAVRARYEEFFTRKLHVEMREELPESMLAELVTAVGPERFASFFEVTRWIMPTSRFTREQFTLPAEIRADLGLLVKQYKPALKVE